jgi:hypothetical protein
MRRFIMAGVSSWKPSKPMDATICAALATVAGSAHHPCHASASTVGRTSTA